MGIFRRAMHFFRPEKNPVKVHSPVGSLREIERDLVHNQAMIERTQSALIKEAEKIGRLRQIEIDIGKLSKAGTIGEKTKNRLRGTKRALELAHQRFDAISERLSESDRFGTVLLARKNNLETALSREGKK